MTTTTTKMMMMMMMMMMMIKCMVETLPELFLQLAEQAEICRTSCDLLKRCPDGQSKFTQHIISARG